MGKFITDQILGMKWLNEQLYIQLPCLRVLCEGVQS